MGKINYILAFLMCIIPLYIINFTHFSMSFALLFLVAMNFLYKLFIFSESNSDLSKWAYNNNNLTKEDLRKMTKKIKELTFIFTIISVTLLFAMNYIEKTVGWRRIDNNIKVVIAKGIMVLVILLTILPDIISTYKINKVETKSTNPSVSHIKTHRIMEKIKDIIS